MFFSLFKKWLKKNSDGKSVIDQQAFCQEEAQKTQKMLRRLTLAYEQTSTELKDSLMLIKKQMDSVASHKHNLESVSAQDHADHSVVMSKNQALHMLDGLSQIIENTQSLSIDRKISVKLYNTILESAGWRPLAIKGQKTRPQYCEVIDVKNIPNMESGVICGVVEQGYMNAKQQVVRTSKVIACKPSQRSDSELTNAMVDI